MSMERTQAREDFFAKCLGPHLRDHGRCVVCGRRVSGMADLGHALRDQLPQPPTLEERRADAQKAIEAALGAIQTAESRLAGPLSLEESLPMRLENRAVLVVIARILLAAGVIAPDEFETLKQETLATLWAEVAQMAKGAADNRPSGLILPLSNGGPRQ